MRLFAMFAALCLMVQPAVAQQMRATAPMNGPMVPVPPLRAAQPANADSAWQAADQPERYYLIPGNEAKAECKEIKVELQVQGKKLDTLLQQGQQIQPPPVPQQIQPPPVPVAEPAKPETLKEKIDARKEEIKDKLEGQPGVLGKFWKAIDNFDHIWLIVAIVGLVILWKKGGIHTIVSANADKLQADANAGGIQGMLAAEVLKLHNSALGQQLGNLEAKINASSLGNAAIVADVAAAKATSQAALQVAGQAAVATVPAAAPAVAAVQAVAGAAAAASPVIPAPTPVLPA